MFPMPRVVYSMASDGLIFKFLAWIAPKLKTPTAASLFTGLFAALMVLVFDLNQLIDMMSIGTLLAYALVSACTLVLRYRPFEYEAKEQKFSKKRSFISLLFGESNQPLMHRLFFPEPKCNRASAHLVNAFGILASNFNYTNFIKL
jgi:amino acid transporter